MKEDGKMETLQELFKCELCGKRGEDLSLLSANHKELGWLMICQECWIKLYDENRMVCGRTGSSGKSSCPTCAV